MEKKNLILSIGLGILLISLLIGLLAVIGSEMTKGRVGSLVYLGIILFIVFPGIILAAILILNSLLVRIRKKAISIPLIIFTNLFIFWGIANFTHPKVITWPFEKLAVLLQNERICRLIPVTKKYNKDQCYKKIALIKRDPSICQKIKRDYMYNYCCRNIAEAMGNELICLKIAEQSERNYCYRDVAVAKKDESICEKIKTPERGYWSIKVICYAEVAREKKDPSICEKLIDPKDVSACYKNM